MQRTKTVLHIVRFSALEKWSANSTAFGKMHSAFPLVPLSKVLKRAKEPINIEDDKTYKRITVRLYGQGVLKRDEPKGSEIGTKRQFVAHAGQLILSRIDARNGAFGIVPEELDGAVVTNDFWLFEVENALPQFLMLVLSSERFQQYWQEKSSGTTNRQRVDEDSFLSAKVGIPERAIQEKLVDQFTNLSMQASALEKDVLSKKEAIYSLWDKLLDIEDNLKVEQLPFTTVKFSNLNDWSIQSPRAEIISKTFPSVPIQSLCMVNSGGTPSRANSAYYHGCIPWVKTAEVVDGEIFDTEEKITEEAVENSSARVYPPGCIIIAMYGQTRGQTAKLMVSAATNQACAVLHNIKNSVVLPDYLWLYMQGQYHRIRKLAVGSAQPNLNAQMIKSYPVILPPIHSDDVEEITQEKIVKILIAKKEKIADLQKRTVYLRQHAKQSFEEVVFGEASKTIC